MRNYFSDFRKVLDKLNLGRQMDRQIYGWIDGRVDRWMDMDRSKQIDSTAQMYSTALSIQQHICTQKHKCTKRHT